MVNVKTQARGTSSTSSVNEAAGGVAVAKPSDISLDLTSSDVSNYARLGDNLVITLADGTSVVIEDFFAIGADGEVSRLFLGGEGELAFVDLSGVGGEAFAGGSVQASPSLAFDVTDAGVVSDAAGAIAPSLAGNAGGIAGGIAAAAGGAAIAAGGAAGGAAAVAVVTSTVSGSIVAGPTVAGHGLTAEVFDAAGNSLGEALVNSDGSFTVSITSDYSGAILVRVKDVDGGTVDYFDEGRGTTVDLTSDMRAAAVVDGAGDYVVNVNVLTELAVRDLGLAGGDAGASSADLSGATTAAVTAANASVGATHGLTGDITSQDVNATIDATGAANPSANLYGEILAAYSGLEVSKDMTLTEVMEAYSGSALTDAVKLDLVSGALAANADGADVAAALGVADAGDVVSGLTAVAAAADGSVDGTVALTATEAEALGLGTLSVAELAFLNEAIDGSESTDVDSVAELQALAAAAVGVAAGAAGTAGEPTLEDLTALGIEGVTDANLPAIQAAIAATADDGSDVSTVADLQNVVTAMVDVLATAAGEPADLSVEDLDLLGVTVTPEQLAAVTAAIAATNVDGTEVGTPADLLAVVTDAIAALDNALTEISAYEGTGDAPSVQDYTDAGVSGITDTNVAAMNSIIAPFLSGATDETAKLQVIADALNNVIAGAAGTATEAAPTIEDLEALGFANVDADNITAVQAVIAAAGVDGVEDLTEIQDLVNGAVDAVATIAAYGEVGTVAPETADYAAAGVDGVTIGNVAAVNDAIAAATTDNSNNLEEIQAVADAMIEVLAGAAGEEGLPSAEALELLGIDITDPANLTAVQAAIEATDANGSGVSTLANLQDVVDAGIIAATAALDVISAYTGVPSDTVPTEQDYTSAGVTDVQASEVALLNSVVADLGAAETDSAADLQPVADAVSGIIAGLEDTDNEPSVADLHALGLTFVTDETLASVQAAIANSDPSGDDVDTLLKLRNLAAAAVALAGPALAEIAAYEGEGTAPSVQDYIDAGVTDVTTANIDAVNALVGPLGLDATNSADQLQDLVDGLNGVIAGATGAADVPTLDQLEALGVPDVTEDNLSAVQAAIAATGDGILVDELSDLLPLVAGVVAAVDTIAAYGEVGAPTPDEATYEAAGITGITDTNIDAVNGVISAATTEDSNSLEEIQALTDAMLEVLDAAANGTADVPSLAALELLGIEDVDADNLVAIQAAIAATNVDGSEVSDLADLQNIVTAMADVADAANNVTTDFTNDDLATLGITVSDDEFLTALAAIVASSDDGSAVISPEAIQELVTQALADLAIISDYNGLNEAPDEQTFDALGITGVSPSNITVVQNMVATLESDQTDSVAEVQAIVDAVGNVLLGASGAADVPTVVDLEALGFTAPTYSVTETNLPAIQLAIAATDDGGNGVDEWVDLRDIISGVGITAPLALDALTSYTGGTPTPTPTTYSEAGVSGVDGDNVGAINDVIATFDEAATATAEQIQALANAMNAVLDGAAGEAGKPELADLVLLGIEDVSAENIEIVQTAIEATENNGDGVATLSLIQDLVSGVIVSLGVISAYAGAVGDTVPDVDNYESAGVAGVDGTNVTAVNALLADPVFDVEATNTAAKVQALVDGLNGVLAGAGGAADVPTRDDLEALGFENVTVDNLSAVQAAIAAAGVSGVGTFADIQDLVNDRVAAIDALSSHEAGVPDLAASVFDDAGLTGLDTVITGVADGVVLAAVNDAVAAAMPLNSNSLEELQAITDGMIAVLDAAANGTANEPSSVDLAALGIEGVTEANLPAIQAAIAATADDGSAVSTIAGLQDVVTAMADVMATAAGEPAELSVEDLALLGVVVEPSDLAAVTAAIAASEVDGSEVGTPADLQAFVIAATDTAATALELISGYEVIDTSVFGWWEIPVPWVQDYVDAGVADVSVSNIDLVNSFIAPFLYGSTNTTAKLQDIVDGVNGVLAGAGNTGEVPTVDNFEDLGFTTVTADNLSAVQAAIAAAGVEGVENLTDIQDLVDATVAAVDTIAAYGEVDAPAPDDATYAAAGVTGVTLGNVDAVNDALDAATTENSNSLEQIQALADAMIEVLAGAAGGDNLPSAEALELLGIDITDPTNIAAVQAAIAATNPDGSEVSTLDALQGVINDGLVAALDALAVITAYEGGGSDTVPTVQHYTDAGVSNVLESDVSLLNDVVAGLDAAATDSVTDLQPLANAVSGVVAGVAGITDEPSLDDLHALGFTSITNETLAAIQNAISNSVLDDVSTLQELRDLVENTVFGASAALETISTYEEGGIDAPSVDDYGVAGVESVTLANIDAVNALIGPLGPDATNTVDQLQALVDGLNGVLAGAGGAADVPTKDDLEALGVPDVTIDNLPAIQAAIAAAGVDGVDELSLLLPLVAGVVVAIDTIAAYGEPDAPAPDEATYLAAGATGVTDANIGMLNELISAAATEDSNSIAEIQTLADAVAEVFAGANGDADVPSLIALGVLGIDDVDADNLTAVQAAIAATADNGSEVATLADLQTLVTAMADVADAAKGEVAEFTVDDLTTLGITGAADAPVTADEFTVVLAAIVASGDSGDQVNTPEAIQELVTQALADLATIRDYNGSNDTPGTLTFATLGVTGFSPTNSNAVLGMLAELDEAATDSVVDIQNVVTATNNVLLGASGTADVPTVADLQALGFEDVSVENIAAVQAAIEATNNSGDDVATFAGLEGVITDALATAATGFDALFNYTGELGQTPPEPTTYTDAGVSGVDADNVDAMNAILAPLGTTAAIDTADKIQSLVDAMNAVLDGAAGETGKPELADLVLLGIEDVSVENIAAVQAAIEATDGDGVATLALIQGLVDEVTGAIDIISAYTGDAGDTVPLDTTYEVAGVTGVDGTNSDAVNALLADPSLDVATTDTAAKVQNLVDGLNGVLAGAGGNAGVPTFGDLEALGFENVTVDNLPAVQAAIAAAGVAGVGTLAAIQGVVNGTVAAITVLSEHEEGAADLDASVYLDAGVTGLDTVIGAVPEAAILAAVNDAVAVATLDNSNSLAEIQAITDGMIAVLDAAANGTAFEPSIANLEALGFEGITDAMMPALQDAIAATADDGTQVDTIADLTDIVGPIIDALALIASFDGSQDALTDTIYADAGVTGVVDANVVNAMNNALIVVTRSNSDSLADVQDVADAVNAVLVGTPTADNLTDIGVSVPTDLSALQAAIAANLVVAPNGSGVDSPSDVQALVDAVDSVAAAAAGAAGEPSLEALLLLGITLPDAKYLSSVQAAIIATDPSGNEVDTPAKLQTLINDTIDVVGDALDTISAYDGSQVDLLEQDYIDAKVTGVSGIIDAVSSAIDDLDPDQTDTTGKIQSIVDAVQAVVDAAGGDATEPSVDDLEVLGIDNVTEENIADIRAIIAAVEVADVGPDGAISTIDAINTVVSDGLAALSTLSAYDDTSATTPDETVYEAAGVTGVTNGNVEDINAFMETLDDGATDSVAEIQAIADGVTAVVNGADANDASAVTLDNLLALGITGASAANLALVQAAIAAEVGDDVDTADALQAIVDAIVPTVVSVEITSDAGNDNTYGEGDTIQFTVEMSEATTVDGEPTLAITVGATPQEAIYVSGSGTEALVFEYVTQLGDLDGDGVTAIENGLAFNGGTLVDATGNAAVITHDAIVASTRHQVDAAEPYRGMKITGGSYSATIAGDVNGDGLADIVIGDSNSNVYVVYGGTQITTTTLATIENDSSLGFAMKGSYGDGWNTFGLGDINNDGFDDIGAWQYPDQGLLIVFGAESQNSATDSEIVSSSRGYLMSTNEAGSRFGLQAISGDFNGDGFSDLVVTEPRAADGGSRRGSAYILFGGTDTFDPNALLNLAAEDRDSDKIVKISGDINGAEIGADLAMVGDINGDGFDDFLMSNYKDDQAGTNFGAAYLILGGNDLQDFDTSELNSKRFEIFGSGDDVGSPYSSAFRAGVGLGDINGDGLDDFSVSVANITANLGRINIIYGTKNTDIFTAENLSISDIGSDNNLGYSISSAVENTLYGPIEGVMRVGDINDDGIDDVAVLARFANAAGDKSGAVHFIYGAVGRTNIDINELADDPDLGFSVFGEASGDNFGNSNVEVDLIGDTNGDGLTDIVISAGGSGTTYIVYGQTDGFKNINLSGEAIGDENVFDDEHTDGSDIWFGTTASESALGGLGDDIFFGGGGADVLFGGVGDDTFVLNADNIAMLSSGIVDGHRSKIVGSGGLDKIELSGTDIAFDFTAISTDRILDVEIIDISGTGANSLVMTADDVKVATAAENTLRIVGGADDLVTLVDYLATGVSEVISGVTYHTYEHKNTTVLVQDGVQIGTSLGGAVVAGPVIAPLSVTLYDEAGNMLAQTTTKDDGKFNIHNLQYTGNVLVVVEDTNGPAADYTDEFTGEAVDLSVPLRAVVDYTGHKTDLSVTPMTELAVRLMGVTDNTAPSGTLAADVNASLSTTFGVDDLLGNAEPVNGGNFATASDAAQSYGFQLASLSALDGLYGSMEIALDRIEAGLNVVTDGNGDVTSITFGSELQALTVPVADALDAYVLAPTVADGPAAALASLLGDGVVIGSDAVDDLDGTAGTEIFALAGGDDVVTHSDGDDYVFGGEGSDTLDLDGQTGVTIDLSRLSSIETVDLTGAGDNTLNLSLEDLTDNVGLTVEFVVTGDTGDTVNLSSTGDTWSQSGTMDISGVNYDGFVAGSVTTWIHEDVNAVL